MVNDSFILTEYISYLDRTIVLVALVGCSPFCEGIAAGVVKFQTEDLEYWPDIMQSDSTFIHRLAVRRSFAGGSVSTQIFQWAIDRTRELGRYFVRLDCVADRPRLRSVYENFGFKHHSDRQVGAYFVARYEYDICDLKN